MGKIAIAYTDVFGNSYAVLQDSAAATALGNSTAAAGTARLPRKIKPRKVGVRIGGSSPYTYAHYVVGSEAAAAALTLGSALVVPAGAGKVAGITDEKNNGYATF